MSYEVKLEIFEGPLDLLLYLIHKNEVSITDIPISLITQQYLETVELMKALNLDVAGEYLLMAAYLTHIKSQMLLPTDPEAETEELMGDPRDELVAHLLEYKRYKDAAEQLASAPLLGRDVFTREAQDEGGDVSRSCQPLDVALPQLLDALRGVLERTSRRDLIELEPERLLVKDKINMILERVAKHEWVTFASLFDEDLSRLQVLTTFLALLEVVKLQLVRMYQDAPFGTILISRRKQVPVFQVLTRGGIPWGRGEGMPTGSGRHPLASDFFYGYRFFGANRYARLTAKTLVRLGNFGHFVLYCENICGANVYTFATLLALCFIDFRDVHALTPILQGFPPQSKDDGNGGGNFVAKIIHRCAFKSTLIDNSARMTQ